MIRASVIIPTLERPSWVVPVLDDLVVHAPSDVEIVVVDQSSPESALPVAEHVASLDRRFRHVVDSERGLPHARNRGLAETSAPVVLFLDDDVRLLPGLVEAHLENYDNPRVGGVVGRIVERTAVPNVRRTANHVGFDGRVRTNLWGTERCHVGALKGANMSLRRAALDAVGGFDPNYLGNALLEDADIAERVAKAGYTLWFDPRAELVHLSAPVGGVRQPDPLHREQWRFHNTGYFMRRHRGVASWPAVYGTHLLVATRRAAEWGNPTAVRTLMSALSSGWRLGGDTPRRGGSERD